MDGPVATDHVTVADEYGYRKDCYPWFLERFNDAFRNEIIDFIDCVKTGREPLAGAEDARKASEICVRLTEALKLGKPITL